MERQPTRCTHCGGQCLPHSECNIEQRPFLYYLEVKCILCGTVAAAIPDSAIVRVDVDGNVLVDTALMGGDPRHRRTAEEEMLEFANVGRPKRGRPPGTGTRARSEVVGALG